MEPTQFIDRDELTPREAAIGRILLGPFRDWNPDIALRYIPIVQIIDDHGLREQVTDVGAGSIGVAPYLRTRVTNVDTNLPQPIHPLVDAISASVLDTPFEDCSRPCVISVDMLEHLPAEIRQPAVDEMVRIAGKLLIVAAPAGSEAQAHDRHVAALFQFYRGAQFRYLSEHLAYGLPSSAELLEYVRHGLERNNRTARVEMVPNAGLSLRMLIVRRWVRRRLLDKVAWVVFTWLSPLLARVPWLHRRRPYRQIVVVEFTDT